MSPGRTRPLPRPDRRRKRDPGPAGEAGTVIRAALRREDSLSGTLRHLLDQLHLGDLDTGDLLLLAILYFLFREGADEELLAALGLLLILGLPS